MSDCVLILHDAPVRPLAPRVADAWPRRPALEYLLARARRAPLDAAGWRQWLAARQGVQTDPDGGIAGIGAAGLGLPAGHYWLATPVHYVAGLDTLRLHPRGLLALEPAAAERLAQDFARVFAGSGWCLHPSGARDLLLAAPAALVAASDDPVHWLGEDPREGLPRGPGARALRTLATEIEMWLHEHAVNRERVSAGDLPVSGLWLWGGGRSVSLAQRPRGRIAGGDLVANALWGAARAPSPARDWASLRDAAAGPWHVVADIDALDEHWLAPLLDDWRAGRIAGIELVAGRWRYQLPRAARWHFWARTVPWWERIA